MGEYLNDRAESDTVKSLKIQLEVVNAQNARLNEENSLIRHKLNRLTNEQRSTSTVNVESRLKLFALEDERDKMYENLERLKVKYNNLHSAYLEKVKRCKSLEEVFSQQKMLPGLVKKSALEHLNKVLLVDKQQQQQQQQQQQDEINAATKIATLQQSLDEAFDIIDELEFELESVDYLEMENERLKNELSQFKKDAKASAIIDHHRHWRNDDHRHDRHSRSSACSSPCDECGGDGLPDVEAIDRSVLTQSLIDTVQTESHLLRRELLRSRLQNTRPHRVSGLAPGAPKEGDFSSSPSSE